MKPSDYPGPNKPLSQRSAHDILDDLTPDAIRALAYAAISAWGQNRMELDDGLDAKQAMLDAIGANMPFEHPLVDWADRASDEIETAQRWRAVLGYVPISDYGEEILPENENHSGAPHPLHSRYLLENIKNQENPDA